METLRDLGLFGMFLVLAFASGLFFLGPIANFLNLILLPLAMIFLSLRRAIIFQLVLDVAELLLTVVNLSYLMFIFAGLLTIMFLPFNLSAIIVFKKLQRRIPFALLGYYLFSVIAPVIIYFGFFLITPLYDPSLVIWFVHVSGLQQMIVATAKMPTIDWSNSTLLGVLSPVALVGLRLFCILILAVPVVVFACECWVLKTLRKRTACLPLSFPNEMIEEWKLLVTSRLAVC